MPVPQTNCEHVSLSTQCKLAVAQAAAVAHVPTRAHSACTGASTPSQRAVSPGGVLRLGRPATAPAAHAACCFNLERCPTNLHAPIKKTKSYFKYPENDSQCVTRKAQDLQTAPEHTIVGRIAGGTRQMSNPPTDLIMARRAPHPAKDSLACTLAHAHVNTHSRAVAAREPGPQAHLHDSRSSPSIPCKRGYDLPGGPWQAGKSTTWVMHRSSVTVRQLAARGLS